MAGRDQDLAGQLAALKERSGLSYGQLATRLHVSTSTLHRYCNGSAIPAEFATLERLARLCGAEREELITLHRTWLLADAERRNEPAASHSHDLIDTPTTGVTAAPRTAPHVARPRRWVAAGSAGVVLAGIVAACLWVILGGSTRSAADPGPPPFSVSVLTDNWDSVCGEWFYAPEPPSKVGPPPGMPDVALWAAPNHAVPGSHLRLQLTVQGAAGQPPVVLHTAYVQVVSSQPAPHGYGYAMDSGCGGGLSPSSFAADLDAASPHLRAVPAEGGGNNAPVDFPVQASASDSQILNIDAATTDRDITWYLELVWSSGTRQGTLRVDDHGKPFHTIGLARDPVYFYNGARWTPYPG